MPPLWRHEDARAPFLSALKHGKIAGVFALCVPRIWPLCIRLTPMERTLRVLNELERDGVLSRYAIGGAMGATFYIEPLLTFDLDIIVLLPQAKGGLLTLTPLYEVLRARGYAEEGECVMIEGVPVQFLPAYNALMEEALEEAREMAYQATSTRVLRVEHLVAICLQTGRAKDRERVRILREQATLDDEYLAVVLRRHHLDGKWKEWIA
jgi:hypothetical protein